MAKRKATEREKARNSNTGRERGIPSKIDDEPRVTMFLQCIVSGAPITHACKAAGIAYRTYRDWYNLGEKGDPRYAGFFAKVQEAEGQFVATCTALIAKAAQREWTAAAWLLERRYPKEFGRRQEISGPDGGPIPITDTGRDRLAKMLEEMYQRASVQSGEPILIGSGSSSPNGHKN